MFCLRGSVPDPAWGLQHTHTPSWKTLGHTLAEGPAGSRAPGPRDPTIRHCISLAEFSLKTSYHKFYEFEILDQYDHSIFHMHAYSYKICKTIWHDSHCIKLTAPDARANINSCLNFLNVQCFQDRRTSGPFVYANYFFQ